MQMQSFIPANIVSDKELSVSPLLSESPEFARLRKTVFFTRKLSAFNIPKSNDAAKQSRKAKSAVFFKFDKFIFSYRFI